MPKNLRYFCLLFFVLFSIAGCKKKQSQGAELQTSNVWEYRNHINDFTTGEISKQAPIRINLAKEVEGFTAGDELPRKILSFQPGIDGKLTLADNSTILFTPKSELKSNQLYTAKLNIKKLFPDDDFKGDFVFQFKTVRPDFSVLIDALQSSETKEGEQEVSGHIETADVMTVEQVKKVLSARQESDKLPIEFKEQEAGKFFPFLIKGIKRQDEESGIVIDWNGKSVGIDNRGSETIMLPGVNDFQVIRFTVENEPEQVVELNFSGEIDKNQNLEGLIELGEDEEVDYLIDGNLLKIFPKKTLSGEMDIIINEGVKSVDDLSSDRYVTTVTFKGLKPAVRMLGSGSILPNSQGLKLNFEAVALRAVDVRVTKIYEKNTLQFLQVNDLNGGSQLKRVGRPVVWKRMIFKDDNSTGWKAYSLDLAKLIETDPGAIYRVEFSFKPNYSLYECGNSEERETLYEDIKYFDKKDTYWDNQKRYYGDDYWDYEVYNWRERENPCHDAYYTQSKSVSTNLLASDLGLISKKDDNGHVLAVTTNLISAKPEAGVEVKFYNYQTKLLGTQASDSKGFARYEGDEEVAFIEAAFKDQKAYLKLKDGNALTMSQFKTEGYTAKDGLKGMLYGERGIWRPGDSIYVSFILNDLANPLPKDHPIKFQLRDPQGTLIDEQVTNKGVNGFYSFPTKTSDSDKTGNYRAKVTVGNVAFYKTIPVEKIKPNRLKVNLAIDGDRADLETKWLHGATAKKLKATVDANVRSQLTTFEGYKDYIFNDPATKFEADEIRVFEGTVNDAGQADFPVDLGDNLNAPGKLRVTYITKVYEKGGSFSIDALSEDFSPYNSYVGISAPKTDNFYRQLETDKKHNFKVATVTEDGKPIAVRDLEVEVYKIDFRWWWNNSYENLASYVSDRSATPVYSTTISTNANGRGSFDFGINYPDWGRYLVRVKNPDSGHATGQTLYFDWPSWRGRSQKDGADAPNILSFTTDKEEYKVGETIKVNFPSTAGGRALVSVESGSNVVDAFWVDPKDDYTSFNIKTTAEMAPNVYINVTYLQQHANTANSLPIRLYGVMPVSVYDAKTKLEPKIVMKNELEPEEVYQVKVKEQKGRPMTYTLAVVDDGLLDLTRFQTPNAWDLFFKKQALGVRTWDVYDDVIGAYSGRIDQILTIGGGDEAEAAGAKKAQRFKPVVTYLGPFELGANQTKAHKIKMPYYVGSVRVMVVAGNNDYNAYGSDQKTVPVKKPLMILGTLPRKISQNEVIDLPVSVFAMDKKVKNVSLQVETNDMLQIEGGNNQQLQFAETGEKEAAFQLRATGKTGIAKVIINATGGGETAKYEVEVDVNNPNEREYAFTDYELGPNQTLNIPVNAISTNGTDEATLQLSTIPNLDFEKRIQELIRYPHGCAEQVTSSVFPQLYLSDIANTSKGQDAEISRNVQDAIYRLKNYQASNGGFSYWPGYQNANDYATSYVGHFLLEAKDKGYEIPFSMLSNWKQYQNKVANKNYYSSSKYTRFAQAYRLYTLALAGDANLPAMNRLRENKNLSKETRWRLAAAYAVAGQKKTAQKLINAIQDDFNSFDEIYRYGSKLRNKAMALETAVLLENKDLSKEFAEDIAKQLSKDRWYSTQTTAYSLIALSQFVESHGEKGFEVLLTGDGQNQNLKTAKALLLESLNPPQGSKTIQLQNKKANTIYVRLTQSGVPPVGQESAASRGLGLTVDYIDLEGKSIAIDQLPQTTEFIAKITVENLSKDYVNDIALTQVIPSGWEIINTRYTELGNQQPSAADYIDIGDDRVNYYFDLAGEKSKTFQLQLNASFTGRYYLPGSKAEAMYAKDDFYVKQKGQWIDVAE